MVWMTVFSLKILMGGQSSWDYFNLANSREILPIESRLSLGSDHCCHRARDSRLSRGSDHYCQGWQCFHQMLKRTINNKDRTLGVAN